MVTTVRINPLDNSGNLNKTSKRFMRVFPKRQARYSSFPLIETTFSNETKLKSRASKKTQSQNCD